MIAAAACYTGPSARSYYGVKQGSGIRVKVLADKHLTEGEVLEVRDSTLVLLGKKCAVTMVPFRAIRKAAFGGVSPAYHDGWPTPDERAELKMLSRFPGGTPQAVLDEYAHCRSGMAVSAVRPDANEFLAIAKRATSRYQQLDSAIAAGYRRIGVDIPSLGEHWVNPGLVMSGPIDPARPSVLIYVRGPSGPVLAGVAWTKVLKAGEPYPDAPASRDAWHEHNGTVAAESLPMHHDHMAMGTTEPTRVAILHAWIWISNPRGSWVAENWALPFARAGLRADGAPIGAARAMSLTAPGATEYYERVVATAAGGDSITFARARTLLVSAVSDAMVVRRSASGTLGDAELARLAAVWSELWTRIGGEPGEPLRALAMAMQ